MDPSLLAPLVVLFLIVLGSAWVLQDARAHERDRRPVVVTVFDRELEDPPLWAALCLLAFVIVFPLYLVARRASV